MSPTPQTEHPATADTAADAKLGWRPIWIVLALSLVVRLAAWGWVVAHDVPALHDEGRYVARAEALAAWISGAAQATGGADAAWLAVYDRGIWPPLQSLLILPGLELGGVAGARLCVLLLSVLSSGLVFALTRRWAGTRAAWAAALLHVFHPSFVAYAHLLWAETSFGCLLLLALCCLQRALAPASGSRGWRWALLVGLCLGAAAWTRASVLPYLVFLPVWLVFGSRATRPLRARLLQGGLAFASAALLIAPWFVVLARQEGRFVLMTTEGGWNLYLGNNPWVRGSSGSSWADPAAKTQMGRALRVLQRDEGLERDPAARRLALERIADAPGAFLVRSVQRARTLWTLDSFVLRHFFHVTYPPVGAGCLVLVALALLVFHLLFFAGVLRGLLLRGPPLRERGWLLALALAGSAPAVVTIAMPRLNLVVLLLLLPVAGLGLSARSALGRRAWVGLALLAGFLFALVTSLPTVVAEHLAPSSWHAASVRVLDDWCGTETLASDRLELQARNAKRVRLRLTDAGHWFRPLPGQAERRPRELGLSLESGEVFVLELVSRVDAEPVRLVILVGEERVVLRPVAAEGWNRFIATGIDGLQLRWVGGGLPPVE